MTQIDEDHPVVKLLQKNEMEKRSIEHAIDSAKEEALMCLSNYRVMIESHPEDWPESTQGQRCLDQCASQMAELHDDLDELRRTLAAVERGIEACRDTLERVPVKGLLDLED